MEETNISPELTEQESKQRLIEIKRAMEVMEWDIKMNQINVAMMQKYEDLKKEYETISTEPVAE